MGKEVPRRFKEERKLSFDVILREDVPCIFTDRQKEALEIYRDGAKSYVEVAALMNVALNTVKSYPSGVVDRLDRAFGETKGNARFKRALGVAILAGWIEPRDFDVSERPHEFETNLVDLMLYGFTHSEAGNILFMSESTFSDRLQDVKDKLNIVTDEELVAWRASEIRKRLVNARQKNG